MKDIAAGITSIIDKIKMDVPSRGRFCKSMQVNKLDKERNTEKEIRLRVPYEDRHRDTGHGKLRTEVTDHEYSEKESKEKK